MGMKKPGANKALSSGVGESRWPEWFGQAEKKTVKALMKVEPKNRVRLWLQVAYSMGLIDEHGRPIDNRDSAQSPK